MVSPVEVFGPSTPTNTSGLRKVIVYGEMFEAFMRVANSNTQRKIETCAILSGTLVCASSIFSYNCQQFGILMMSQSKDVFHITTMIVPKQGMQKELTCVLSKDILTIVSQRALLIHV